MAQIDAGNPEEYEPPPPYNPHYQESSYREPEEYPPPPPRQPSLIKGVYKTTVSTTKKSAEFITNVSLDLGKQAREYDEKYHVVDNSKRVAKQVAQSTFEGGKSVAKSLSKMTTSAFKK